MKVFICLRIWDIVPSTRRPVVTLGVEAGRRYELRGGRVDRPPTTEQIVDALLALGCEGPAAAVDVLNAAAMVLPGEQLVAVLEGVSVAGRGFTVEPVADPGA
jgi:hypothetical protein